MKSITYETFVTPPTDFDDGIVLDNLEKRNSGIVKDSHETYKSLSVAVRVFYRVFRLKNYKT